MKTKKGFDGAAPAFGDTQKQKPEGDEEPKEKDRSTEGLKPIPGAPLAKGDDEDADDKNANPFAKKSDDADEDDEGGEKEEGEEMEGSVKKCAKKSEDLTRDDLEKSLQKLEAIVQDGDTTSRKDALLAKAQASELSKSEREELFGILGGESPKASTTGEDITKGLKDNSTLQKALDVSDYLTEQHTELCKSLGAVGEVVQKSDARQHEFNLVLAKAVADVGHLVKSVAETVGAIAGQPARAPKSAGVQGSGKVLSKSFAGNPGGEGQLSKAEILDTLDTMMEKSMAAGKNGITEHGNDILMAISKYEQTSQMSPGVLAEVQAFRNRAVTH